MNYKIYDLVTDIINMILMFFVTFSILGILILFFTEDQSLVYSALILLPAPIISYIIGKRTKHIWSLTLLHLVLLGFYLYVSHEIILGVLYGFYLAFLLISEFRQKLKDEFPPKTNTSLLLLTIFFLMYFTGNYLELKEIKRVSLILVILFILFYLLNMYLLNFRTYFKNNEHISNIPIHQIKLSNNILIVFYSSLSIIIMFLFTKLPYRNLLSSVGNTIIAILRFIFSFLFHEKKELVPPVEVAPIDYSMNSLPTDNEPSPIIDFILNLLFYILGILVIIVFITLIIYGVYKLYQQFYSNKMSNEDDETVFISPFDKKEKLEKELKKSPLQKLSTLFGKSNNEKIRKLYYKAIVRNAKSDQLEKGLTPSKLSEYALTPASTLIKNSVDLDKAKTLTEYYEKARYSNVDSSKEELENVKAILKYTNKYTKINKNFLDNDNNLL